MSQKLRDRACGVCHKLIPAGTGAFRRGIQLIHVECATKTEKGLPQGEDTKARKAVPRRSSS